LQKVENSLHSGRGGRGARWAASLRAGIENHDPRVLEILATYEDRHELFSDYPDLEEADLRQALAFAAATVDGAIDLHLDAA
jgi:hypothetical protein